MLKMTREEKRNKEFQEAYHASLKKGNTETRALRDARRALEGKDYQDRSN